MIPPLDTVPSPRPNYYYVAPPPRQRRARLLNHYLTTPPPVPVPTVVTNDPPTAADMKTVKTFLKYTTIRATAALKSGIVVPNLSFGNQLLVPVAKQLARFLLGLINGQHPVFCNGGRFQWPSLHPMSTASASSDAPRVPVALGTADQELPAVTEFLEYTAAKTPDIIQEGFRTLLVFQGDILDPAAREVARLFLGLINPEHPEYCIGGTFTWP